MKSLYMSLQSRKRTFSIVDFPNRGNRYGEYRGSYPAQAASKAFSRLSRIFDLKNTTDERLLVFTIEEKGSGRQFKYVGRRVELAEPEVFRLNGREVSRRYRNVITKYRNIGLDGGGAGPYVVKKRRN